MNDFFSNIINDIKEVVSENTTRLAAGICYFFMYLLFFELAGFLVGLVEFSVFFVPAGLRFLFFLIFGWRFAFFAYLAEVLAQGAAGEWGNWGESQIGLMLLSIAAPVISCSLAISLLDRITKHIQAENHLRLIIFVSSAALIAPLIGSPLSVLTLIYADRFPIDVFWEAVMSFWVGDAIGIYLVLIPSLVILSIAPMKIGGKLIIKIRTYMGVQGSTREYPGSVWQSAVILPIVTLGFALLGFPDQPVYWYPAFVVLIFLTLANGWIGTSLCIITFNILSAYVAVQTADSWDRFSLQAFLLIFSFSGIVLAAAIRDLELRESEIRRYINEILNSSRREGVGDTGANLVHEMIQPISILGIYSQEALRSLSSAQHDKNSQYNLHRAIEKISEISSELHDISKNIHDFLKNNLGEMKEFTLYSIANKALWLVQSARPDARDIIFDSAHKEICILGHPVLIQQAVMNLLNNAIQATPPGDRHRINLRIICSDDFIEVILSNPIDINLFNSLEYITSMPFGDSSQEGLGLGLGLHLTKKIVEAHHGTLSHEITEDNFVHAKLKFPHSQGKKYVS